MAIYYIKSKTEPIILPHNLDTNMVQKKIIFLNVLNFLKVD